VAEHRALTVQQPWAASFFIDDRPKDVENRSRRPPKGAIGQRLWIHAGLGFNRGAIGRCRALGLPMPDEPMRARSWPRGVILGSVLLVDVLEEYRSPWRIEVDEHGRRYRYAWVVADPRPLATPVPCMGNIALGWYVPRDVAAKLEEASAT
jgi:hypothetical protein